MDSANLDRQTVGAPDQSDGSRPRAGKTSGAGSSRFSGRAVRWAWRIARDVAVPYVLIVVALMFLENSMIFYPSPYPEGMWHPEGLPFEDVEFSSADGTLLHGWYIRHPKSRGAVLFCHGNAGNVTHREPILRRLHDISEVTVFIFDYRGYGRSQGKPNEAGVLADARAAREWLARREGVAPDRLIMMGESLGGAVAVDLAAERGARGLILESTFTNLRAVAAYHFPWLPVRYLMRTSLDSLSKIKDYHGPLLQSHGDRDTIVPYQFGRRLFEAANEPKQFTTFPDGDHNDLRADDYYAKVGQFVSGLKKDGSEQARANLHRVCLAILPAAASCSPARRVASGSPSPAIRCPGPGSRVVRPRSRCRASSAKASGGPSSAQGCPDRPPSAADDAARRVAR